MSDVSQENVDLQVTGNINPGKASEVSQPSVMPGATISCRAKLALWLEQVLDSNRHCILSFNGQIGSKELVCMILNTIMIQFIKQYFMINGIKRLFEVNEMPITKCFSSRRRLVRSVASISANIVE